MDNLFLQAKTLVVSVLGIIAIIPGPNREGVLRIRGRLNNIISYVGILFLLGPWIAIPFLPQPRFIGSFKIVMMIVGSALVITGIALYTRSFRALLPAFKDQFSEFTPKVLIVDGPYRYVRHPIYFSSLMILFGLYVVLGATLSLMFLPLCYLILRLVIIYEEKWILEPKFSVQYREYRNKIRDAIIGDWGGLAFVTLYFALMIISLIDFMELFKFRFIQ